MLGFKYFKGAPTTYYFHYSSSKLKRKGPGLSFVYWAPTSVLAAIPLETQDFPFAFTQISKDFQEVTLQGQISYRVIEPDKLAGLIDYSINERGAYNKEAPAELSERIARAVQIATKELVQSFELKDVLDKSELISEESLSLVRKDQFIAMSGIEILSTAIHQLSPNPNMARALEAATRESLQKSADKAMYDRRNSVVEQERKIKENELLTDIAVEEKRRQIRETKIAADIAIELQREQLIAKKNENDKKEADTRAYALEATMKPIRDMDWRILMAAQNGQLDPKTMIAFAFREMAENASKIGELNISPDLLNTLLKTESSGSLGKK